MHGAGGGQPAGSTHPNYRHGMRTKEWTEQRKQISELIRELGTLHQSLYSKKDT
jgi:hypothetical protein